MIFSSSVGGGKKGSRKDKNAQDEIVKEQVRQKLGSGEYFIVKIDEGHPQQSPAWQKFGRVARKGEASEADSPPVLLNFVQCLNPHCGIVKMLSSGGRGALAKHDCKTQNVFAVKPPAAVITDLEGKVIELIVRRLLPVDLVDAPELSALLQECVNVGKSYGNVDITSMLPHSKTLTDHIKARAHAARFKLVEDLRDDIEDGLASATVDGWTDAQRGRKYMGHTVANINADFELTDNVLFTPHCDAESVTATVIKDVIKTNMAEISLNPDSPLHYVTDDGADVKKAVDDKDRTYCADHGTNLTVKKALHPQLTKLDLYGREAGLVLKKINTAVNLIKGSRMQKWAGLKCRLVKGPNNRLNQTRYRSCVPMLRKVKVNFAKVRLCFSLVNCPSEHRGQRVNNAGKVASREPSEK